MNDKNLQLLDAWRHNGITQSAFEVLQARLKTDARLRAELRTLAEIEEGLSALALAAVHDPSMATGGETLPTPDSNRSSWLPWSIATVACMIAVAAIMVLLWPDAAQRRDPPRAGDELAAMWLVHWSAPAGRTWQVQLIDVMKPNEPGWNFLRAATWGKAIYVHHP